MAKKKFNGILYKYTDEHTDSVYRFVVVDGEVTDIYVKCSRNKEVLITDKENYKEAYIVYFEGTPITQEQYEKYDPRLGLIACGLVVNGVNGVYYNPEHYEQERKKGIKRGY